MKKNLLITYLAAAGDGISGGTRIHIECTKQWIKNKTFSSVTTWASNDGYERCHEYGVPKENLVLMDTSRTKRINFWVDYVYRIIKGVTLSFTYKLESGEYVLYAASDFWADFFPAFIIHLRHKNSSILVTPIYLFAPPPLKGYDGKALLSPKLIVYFCLQKVMMFFARKFSNAIFVTYYPDLNRLKHLHFTKQPQFVIVGGVEMDVTKPYIKKKAIKYDAVFVGRYHEQKGIYQLLNIWKLVTKTKPLAKLAVLGNGDVVIETYIKNFIKSNKLTKNIFLLGFKDGKEKYELFASTRIYMNTNLYDAGGMATMEAMSCALPVVSFDFPASRSMIGDGVLWAKYLDEEDFAKKVLQLLNSPSKIKVFGAKARKDMQKYAWETTAKRVVGYFNSIKTHV